MTVVVVVAEGVFPAGAALGVVVAVGPEAVDWLSGSGLGVSDAGEAPRDAGFADKGE